MAYRITYKELSIVIHSARTQQAAVRLALRYWIANKNISRQPKTSLDWPSSYEGVEVEVLGT